MNSLKEFMDINNSNEIMIGNSWINYFPYITKEVDFSPTSDLIMVNLQGTNYQIVGSVRTWVSLTRQLWLDVSWVKISAFRYFYFILMGNFLTIKDVYRCVQYFFIR